MPDWDVATWGLVIAGVGVLVAVGAWLLPRSPRRAAHVLRHEQLRVKTSNHFPLFDHADGSGEAGDHLVAVTVSNGTGRPVKAINWGVRLPGNRNLVVLGPTTSWEPSLPHWIQPGDEATWYLRADDVRRQAQEHGCAFRDMRGYVCLADGREVAASVGLPLA